MVAFGPIFCLIALVVELLTGPVVHWFALPLFAALLSGFISVQVVAARRHASVELTSSTLRQGTEDLPITEIVKIMPPADPEARDHQPWETARSLGELSAVPRRRSGIGLRLNNGALVQAWAKDDEGLREQLESLLAKSTGGSRE
ncbi:hypothetical protein BFN03_12630 [Rhodococcus sp. WMMA185]|uniref:hypothetical protein n=1 Tax=Rhodococcus sp. WMMA185 TaxID=679318 RepID=UPI0008789A0E|nr:hypothetical protein [Rhodococcus sp. WMMA185]AOW94915.1 hypothetical protein BFN03_12630 [Rhodococcus sp. WMMA185]